MSGNKHDKIDHIKALMETGEGEDVVAMLDRMLENNPNDDLLLYTRGNAKRKKGDWAGAINDYLAAKTINPDSPAVEAANMLNSILEFRNKDLYNQ